MAAPLLTVAVIHHQWRGYPDRALGSITLPQGVDAEFLLVTGEPRWMDRAPVVEIAGRCARVVPVAEGDRAAAKNLALREAHGEFVILMSSEMIAAPGAVSALLDFIGKRGPDAVASAVMLNENGRMRRTAFSFPSLIGETNPAGWLWRRRHQFIWTAPPVRTQPLAVAAVRTQFLMARREAFLRVGDFTSGYRFSVDDLEWCARARKAGIGRWIVPQAGACNLAPQLHGEVPPDHRVAMEDSLVRLTAAMRGPAYAGVFRSVRRAKTLVKWCAAAAWNRMSPAHSNLLTSAESVHRALWRAPDAPPPLPPDAESHSRWEASI